MGKVKSCEIKEREKTKLKLQRGGEGKRYFPTAWYLYGAIFAVSRRKKSRIIPFHFLFLQPFRASKLRFSPSEGETGTGEPTSFVSAQFGGRANDLTHSALKIQIINLCEAHCGVLQIVS